MNIAGSGPSVFAAASNYEITVDFRSDEAAFEGRGIGCMYLCGPCVRCRGGLSALLTKTDDDEILQCEIPANTAAAVVRCAQAAMMGRRRDCSFRNGFHQADMAEVERLAAESYPALAGYLAGLFFGDDFDSRVMQRELDGLYDFPRPARSRAGRYTLELFTVRLALSRISAPVWAG